MVSEILHTIRRRTWLLVFSSAALAAGCGHSEEEWQAQLAKEAMLRQQCDEVTRAMGARPGYENATPTPPPTTGCGRDLDCKGDRICRAGRCESPKLS
jgi:hypothetical protein